MYNIIEQETRDIDWFFTDSNHLAFVASAGGALPSCIAKSKEIAEYLSEYFLTLPDISKVEINVNGNDILIEAGQAPNELQHLDYFLKMSKKGLYSYDKVIVNNFNDYKYYLVSSPTTPLALKDLPDEVKQKICKSLIQINQLVFDIKNDF